MALHMRLLVNGQQVGYLVAQRQDQGEQPHDDAVCTYTWQVGMGGQVRASVGGQELRHRYGDGAWALVAKVIEASGHSAAADDTAYNRGYEAGLQAGASASDKEGS